MGVCTEKFLAYHLPYYCASESRSSFAVDEIPFKKLDAYDLCYQSHVKCYHSNKGSRPIADAFSFCKEELDLHLLWSRYVHHGRTTGFALTLEDEDNLYSWGREALYGDYRNKTRIQGEYETISVIMQSTMDHLIQFEGWKSSGMYHKQYEIEL